MISRLTLLALLFVLKQNFAQIDIQELPGAWYITDIKTASNSPNKLDAEDLIPELEIMQDGYMYFSADTLVFINFKGNLEADMAQSFNYTYNSNTRFLEMKNASTNGHNVNRLRLIELNKNKLVYQFVNEEYIIDYQFIRAKPDHLLCGLWQVNQITVPNLIHSASSDKKNTEINPEKTLLEKFRRMTIELEKGYIGYIEVPSENGAMHESNLKWSLSSNMLHLIFDDNTSRSIRIVSIKHNELIIELPNEDYVMIVTFNRR
jgi:hypothetical protein